MSVTGLIKLMEMAKKGAKFGELSPRRLEIDNIDVSEINAAQIDIATFLSTSVPEKSKRITGVKTRYLVNRYTGQYLWLYENFTKKSTMYNIPIAREIDGPFEPVRLISALEKLLKRHTALCGRYQLDGEDIIVDIASPDAIIAEIHVGDISDFDEQEQQNLILNALNEQCNVPFDLCKEPPLRCHILRKNELHHYLFLTFHHCVVDGWTANLLIDELSRDYHAEVERSHYDYDYDSDHTFFRFLEDPFLTIANVDDSLEFWRNELRQAPAKHSLNYDIAITEKNKKQNIVRTSLPDDLQHLLVQLAQHCGTSLFTLLHTAFALLIARASASERIVIGSPVANRNEPMLNSAIGSFVNTIAYQFHIISGDSFSTLLRNTADKFARAFKHQGLPFSYLVEHLNPIRGKFHPVFQIMFVCQHRKSNELILGLADVSTLPRDYAPPKFDLVLEVISTAGGIQFEWQYNSSLFVPQRIKALAQSYALLLQQIAREPLQKIGYYSLALDEDTPLLHRLSVGAEMPQFLQQNLAQRLWLAGKEHASLPALIDGERTWNYDELFHHASIIAQWLNAHTTHQALIAIDLARGAWQAIAVLGVVLSGRAYLPLAEELPDMRAANIISSSGCECVLNAIQHRNSRYPHGICCQSVESILSVVHSHNNFYFTPGKAHDLAYVIYTSGTTGIPKGVAIEHSAVTNTLLVMNQLFNISVRDNVLAISDLAFDLSVYDLFGSWLAGATVISLSVKSAKEPALWLKTIREHQISIWNSVPAILQMLVQYCEQENIVSLPELRQIWLSGDRIPPLLISQTRKLCPDADITSLGGATEGTIWSIYYPLTRETRYRGAIPYGTALPNQSIWVLDEHFELCSFGVTGDIYIGGAGVAREYWRDQPTTNNSFIMCPKRGERLYRTGDRGRWHRSGYIEFIGREDQQVKLQGFRVELGDVEFALKNSKLVNEACAICLSDPDSGVRYLEAYVSLSQAGKLNDHVEDRLREHLASSLPAYMLPIRYHVIGRFPLSLNGKLDRSLLSQSSVSRKNHALSVSAGNPELLFLQTLLAETLGCATDQIDPNTSFFNNGGSSLSGITFLGKIKRALNVELTLAEILGYQTMTSLAEKIQQNCPLALSTISGSVSRPSLPTLYLVHGAGGHVYQYAGLIRQLSSVANIITLASPELATPRAGALLSMQQLATAHLVSIPQSIRNSAVIAGWSLGGQLAIHMAALAAEQNEPFAHAVVIDSNLPSLAPERKGNFSVANCYMNLFDYLGIERHLCHHKEVSSQASFIELVREYYILNQSLLQKRMTPEHAETFCWAMKKSFELTDNVDCLPQLNIPLTLWLRQERLRNQPDLSRKWRAQSTSEVSLTYCSETHYSILNNPQLQQSLTNLLSTLSATGE